MSVPSRLRLSNGNDGVACSRLHVPRDAHPAWKRAVRAKDDDSPTRWTNHACAVGNFRQLRAWQEAVRFVVLSRPAIRRLPPEERFSLAAQWRRAAYSVALNLAEGAARSNRGNFRRHVDIARGSLDELESILELVKTLDYLPENELQALYASRSNCARMVAGLLRRLRDD